jgi:hypothetical protein
MEFLILLIVIAFAAVLGLLTMVRVRRRRGGVIGTGQNR